ncbi:hypothetical protein EDB19DRAFT_1896988 [Suillus lakei]|nr:hypothetical protein EDB19DRAFT_1896988 [Suillus lakei]
MDHEIWQRLNNVLQCLEVNKMTISHFIEQLLQSTEETHESAKNNLVQNGSDICTHLYQYSNTRTSMSLWAHGVMRSALKVFADAEHDLGEIGGDNGVDESAMSDTSDSDKQRNDSCKQHLPKRSHAQVEARNTTLQIIKTVVCISIILQSLNERCNYLHGLLGIFFHSMSVPQKVIDVLAHAGLSISVTSIHNAIHSMSKEVAANIKQGIRSLKVSFAYDNFDIDFKTSEPTIGHHSTFVSATSTTLLPLVGIDNPDALHCSTALWGANSRNPAPSIAAVEIDEFDMLKHHINDTYSRPKPGKRISPRLTAFVWHVRNILVQHGWYFGTFADKLGEPESVLWIPVTKTDQIPFHSMRIKQSTADGNMEVMENLLRQGGIGDPTDKDFESAGDVDMSEYVLLIHGDLLTKEWLNMVRDTRRIESTPKN